MQYHPIRVNMKIRDLAGMISNSNITEGCSNIQPQPTKIVDLRVYGDYIYLDTEERRRFVANTHEYLIDQIQYTLPVTIP